jgi:hypothetical protein
VWRARIVLLSAAGAGVTAIVRATGKTKQIVYRWRAATWRAKWRGLSATLPLIADGRRLRIEAAEAAQLKPSQHQPDGGTRHGKLAGDLRPGHALARQPLDLGDALGRHRRAVSGGRRTPVA